MRLLLGLVLGVALMAQPAVAGPKEEKKEAKAERKAEKKQESAPPAPAAQPAPGAASAGSQPAPGRTSTSKPKLRRRQPAPAPTSSPTASPSPTTVPAPHVPVAPVLTAAPVPTAAPAPVAAPVRSQKRPARRRRAPSRRPRQGVRGFVEERAEALRVPAVAAIVTPLRPTLAAPAPRRSTATPRPAPAPERRRTSPPTTAVTRVISVIPTPFRFLLAGLAMLAGLLALRARRLETQRQDLSDDLGLLQSALLPVLPERIARAWVSAAYRPAEGLAAGGDFYDAFALDEHRTCLLVGDVAGHGRDAVPLTADVRFTLRAYLEAGLGPRAALRATAAVMQPRLHGRFVTVVVAVLDGRTGRLTYSTAGHPPPLLAGTGERLITAASCPALGTGLPTGLRETTIALPPGATACFYTDGLADAKDAAGRRVGPNGVARHLAALGPRGTAAKLLERLVRDTSSQPDDMAACLLRAPLGAATTLPARIEQLELVSPDDNGRARRFLTACGVPDGEAEAALAAAHDLLPVVLEVHCAGGSGTVAVDRPQAVALSLS